jgi:hypothetical protein
MRFFFGTPNSLIFPRTHHFVQDRSLAPAALTGAHDTVFPQLSTSRIAGSKPQVPAQVRTARRFCFRALLLAGRFPWFAFLIFLVGLAMTGCFLVYVRERNWVLC